MKTKKKNQLYATWAILLCTILAACSLNPGKLTGEPAKEQTGTPGISETSQAEVVTQQPAKPTPSPTRPAYLEVDEQALNGVSLEFLHPWTNETNAAIQALVSQFNKNNQWSIRVNATSFGGAEALQEELKDRLGTGDMPDVVAINPYLVQGLDGDYFWLDLSQFITDDKWGLDTDTLKAIPDVFLEQNTVNGKVIGLPFGMSGSFLMYNLSWAKELGFTEPPSTPGELQEQLCAASKVKLTDNDFENNGTGGMWISNSPLAVYAWYGAFGGQAHSGDGSASFNNQATGDSFLYIKDLFDQSCAWIGRQPTPYDYFANRYTLAYPASLIDLHAQESAFAVSENQDEWILIPYPTPDGKGSWIVDGNSLIVKVAEPETQMASWLFARWLTSSAAQDVFSRASLLWPTQLLSTSTLENISSIHPQMDDLIPVIEKAQPAPTYPSWTFDRLLLQDAFWQFLTGYQQELPDVLSTLDAMVEEMYEMQYGN